MYIPVLKSEAHPQKIPSEDKEQMLFVQWMRRNYPEHRIFHVPNGGKRSMTEAAKFKALGVSKGIPDLMVPSLKLFIEMKRTNNSVVSEEQQDWIKYLNSVGYTAKVCYGKDDAIDLVKKLLT